MTPWQHRARNKASEDKRKGAKQGKAIVDWMRKQDDIKREASLDICTEEVHNDEYGNGSDLHVSEQDKR